MDFISKVIEKQEKLGMTDKELARKSGINEYTLYYLKKYRHYLTRVAYFTLCSVLNIPKVKNIEGVLEENRRLVGQPESNLTIAAESVNPEYVEKLEKELNALKTLKDRVDLKDEVINTQNKEIESLTKRIEELETKDKNIEKEAYSSGIKEGLVRLKNTFQVEKDLEFVEAENKYKEEIHRLKESLSKEEQRYYAIFSYLAFELKAELGDFGIPRLMTIDEINKLNKVKENE